MEKKEAEENSKAKELQEALEEAGSKLNESLSKLHSTEEKHAHLRQKYDDTKLVFEEFKNKIVEVPMNYSI